MLAFIIWLFLLLKWGPGYQLTAFHEIISLSIEWAAVLRHCNRDGCAPMMVLESPCWCPDSWFIWPWVRPELLFCQGRGNVLLNVAQASLPNIVTRVRRAASWPTLWQPQGEQQRNSCWWTAGWIKSASAGSAVGKGQRLQQSFGCCEKLPSGYVGSVLRVWASQPRAGCRGEAGAMPGTLGLVPHSWGHPDVPVMVLQLLTALICIPSSSCSDAWVRKISECRDYT